MQPRILFLDIETKLVELYSFGIRDQYITHKQIKDIPASGRMIHCAGLKWAGERKTRVLSEWEHGYEGMMQGVHDALSEADAVATYNGASFDMPKINGQFMLLRMDPPPPPTQIDIFKTTRKMGFVSSKLDYIAPLLGLGHKVKHPGLEMWVNVLNGCPKSQRKMSVYCAGDVRLTEDVFNVVRPHMAAFPRLYPRAQCPRCGGNNTQRRGELKSAEYNTPRIFCNDCRAWDKGRREKIA